jgi:hypothetical protein
LQIPLQAFAEAAFCHDNRLQGVAARISVRRYAWLRMDARQNFLARKTV